MAIIGRLSDMVVRCKYTDDAGSDHTAARLQELAGKSGGKDLPGEETLYSMSYMSQGD